MSGFNLCLLPVVGGQSAVTLRTLPSPGSGQPQSSGSGPELGPSWYLMSVSGHPSSYGHPPEPVTSYNDHGVPGDHDGPPNAAGDRAGLREPQRQGGGRGQA